MMILLRLVRQIDSQTDRQAGKQGKTENFGKNQKSSEKNAHPFSAVRHHSIKKENYRAREFSVTHHFVL